MRMIRVLLSGKNRVQCHLGMQRELEEPAYGGERGEKASDQF